MSICFLVEQCKIGKDYSVTHLELCDSPSFVCVEVLRPSQTNGVKSSALSLPKHTFTGQA